MIRFLAQAALTLIGNALGLIAAALVLPDFQISGFGFTVSIVFFTVAQIVLAPFVLKLAIKLQCLLDSYLDGDVERELYQDKRAEILGEKKFAGANRTSNAWCFDVGRTDETMDRNCRFYL